jgi:DNA-nicking Smr family endonuclease
MNGQPVELPIDGVLDLHEFSPGEIGELVPDYLAACLEKGITQVRIIHGKGKGILRSRVHSILRKQSEVESFGLAGENAGGWGATIVHLRLRSG